MGLRAAIPGPLGLLPKHASYWLCVLLFRKSLHELLSLQGDTFLRFYPVSLMYCSAMQSRCASRGYQVACLKAFDALGLLGTRAWKAVLVHATHLSATRASRRD